MSASTETGGNGVRRNALGQVVAGSGAINPGGRPKGDAWFRELCREKTEAALKALADALEDPDSRVSAAKALLEFGWGKAPSVLAIETKNIDANPAQPLTTDQLLIIARSTARSTTEPS